MTILLLISASMCAVTAQVLPVLPETYASEDEALAAFDTASLNGGFGSLTKSMGELELGSAM